MTNRTYFTDKATSTLTYTGQTTVDSEVDPSSAETVVLDSQWNDFFDTNEYVQFRGTVAKPIVQPYFLDGEFQRLKKDEDELKQAQAQIEHLPWTIGHPDKKRVTDATQIRGFWTDPQYNDGQQATLNVPANDVEAVRYAVSHDAVSPGFGAQTNWTDNTEYDGVQREMAYDHIASVETGRCSPEDGCQLHNDDDVEQHGVAHTDESVGEQLNTDVVRTKTTEESNVEGGSGGMNPTFETGQWVSWPWSGGTARGQIESVHTNGEVSVNGTTRNPSEEGEPAYKIRHYDERDGSFGNIKIAYESNLSESSDPRNTNDSTKTTTDSHCTECSYGPCSCGRHVALTVPTVVDATHLGELDLTPPQAAQEAAQTALEYRDDTDAMQSTGWDRAEQLAAGEELDPSDISDGTDGMANWWARHESHTVSSDSDSLKRERSERDDREYVPKADDNSWIAGKGWGGIAGMNWAMRMDERITELRETNDSFSDASIMDTISYDGLMGGELDESEIPSEGYDDHYVFDAETKSDSSYPLVDADGNLRRGNIDAAFQLYGHAEDEELLLDVLETANKRFADADGYTAPIDEDSLETAMTTDSFTDTTMSIHDFIDEHDLSTDDVIDRLDIDVPESPTDFYDSEPGVDHLREDFTAVEALADSKESLEDEVETLNDELQEYKTEDFADKAERLAELTDRDKDTLVEQFQDGDLTIDEVDEKITVAEEAIGSTATTINTDSAEEDTDSQLVADNDGTINDSEIDRTQNGRYNLSSHDI